MDDDFGLDQASRFHTDGVAVKYLAACWICHNFDWELRCRSWRVFLENRSYRELYASQAKGLFLTFFRNMSLCFPCSYFVPEDGDSEDYPNVFLAPKPRQQGYPPTLAQVKSAFPLPGRYHFRFKSPLVPGADREKGAMPVWMDCVDDRQSVPAWRGTIVAKVTRLAAEEEDDDDDDDADFHRPAPTPAPAPAPVAQQRAPAPPPAPPAPAPAPSLDIFGGPSPVSHQSAPNSRNIFDSHPPPAPAASGGDLLGDMHGHTSYGASTGQAAAAHNDFLGMTSPPTSGGLTPQQQQQMFGGSTNSGAQQQRGPPRHSGSFDSFGGGSMGGNSNSAGGAFGGLGTPWKN